MTRLPLLIALVATGAVAGDQRMLCVSCSLLAPGTVRGEALTLSGTMTAARFAVTGTSASDGLSFAATSNRIAWAGGAFVDNASAIRTNVGFKSDVANAGDGLIFANEAEIQWPSTKIAEVGSDLDITAPQLNLQTTALIVASGAQAGLYGSSTDARMRYTSNVSAANAGSTTTTAAHRHYTEQALDATDWSHEFGDASNASAIFAMEYQGVLLAPKSAPGTAGSGTGFTTNYTNAIVHRVHKITVTEAALAAAAGTEDETIWTIPAKTRVLRMIAEVTQTFSGGALTNVTMTCGTSAGGNQYLVGGAQCDVGITETPVCGDVAADIGAGLTSATVADIPSFTGTTAIQCRFTCTGANCVAATTGSVTFYIEHLVYP